MTTDHKPRCNACGRTLAGMMTRPWEIKCRRCGAKNRGDDIPLGKKPLDKQLNLER